MYLLLPPTVTYLRSTFSPLRPLRHSLDTYLYLTITPHVCTPPTNESVQTHVLGAMPKTENTKKAAGNAKKAEAAAAKQAAEDQKRAAAESKEWSKGAKDNSKA